MVGCAVCKPSRLEMVPNNMDCVEAALQALSRHFAEYKTIDLKRQQELADVKEQNAKLRRIVELMQKQKTDSQANLTVRTEDCYSNKSLSVSAEQVDEESPSKLDTAALNCGDEGQSLDCSPIDSSQRSNVEIIAETEAPTYTSSRQKRIARQMSKLKVPLKDLNCNAEVNKSHDFDLPHPNDSADAKIIKKQISLSLRSKGAHLKQTRLHFEHNQQENSCMKKQSPRPLNQSKSALSWILSGTSRNNSKPRFEHNKTIDEYDNGNETFLIPPTTNTEKSLVLLSPKSPEIIYLDESSNNQLPSTNLNETLLNEKDRAKMESNLLLNKNESVKETLPAMKSNASSSNATLLPIVNNNKRIKTEKDVNIDALAQEMFENMTDSDDDSFDVRPIIVKNEPKTPKRSIKERFHIQCSDCEEFFDNNKDMSDEEINKRLKNCKHYRHHHEFRITQTPEGFWNPLMLSLPADDPRKTVLIDDRFKRVKGKLNFK